MINYEFYDWMLRGLYGVGQVIYNNLVMMQNHLQYVSGISP